jgi:phosphopantothenoylcysteine decarboxylase
MNILLAATGSVATIKYRRLYEELSKIGTVKGALTEKAKFFIKDTSGLDIYDEAKEWDWEKIGDPIPHIDLKDWADILVIAPLSANTLTKMTVGICDNLLTTIYYAWPKGKHIVVAPAMNTDMWNNELTKKRLIELADRHGFRHAFFNTIHIINPVEAKLACGVTGIGAMAPINDIVNKVSELCQAKV